MFRRLLALMLVIALALPAVVTPALATTAPVESAMAAMEHHDADHRQSGDHGQPAQNHATNHICIGCIVSVGSLPFAFSSPLLTGADLPRWIAHRLPSRREGPETPPPRIA
jgi:hypothetical protein